MSKKSFCKYICLFALGLALPGCGDDQWTKPRADDNAINFRVTSGLTDARTFRATDAAQSAYEPLEPLVLRSAELERPLYLHTYVAEESERATGTDGVETRSMPVNDMEDFYTVNGNEGFEVSAYYSETGKQFMNQAVAKRLSANPNEQREVWNTTPVYYWPNNDKPLCFYAIAPLSAKSSLKNLTIAASMIAFSYTVPHSDDGKSDAEQQPDLMLAIKECNKATSDGGKAPLNFRHALSAIKFAIRDVVGGTIKDISIRGVAGAGRCIYNGPEADSGQDTFTWADNTTYNQSYSQVFDYTTAGNNVENPADDSKDIVLNDNMPEKTFMLIPQDIDENAEIEVTFVRAMDNREFKLTGKIRDNSVTRWEPGKEYIYTISTSSSNWTYHFTVMGCEQEAGDDDPGKAKFNEAEGKIVVNQTVEDGAFYKVSSYRERTNNPTKKEPVAWTAVATDGTTTLPAALDAFKDKYKTSDFVIAPTIWMPKNVYAGSGSVGAQTYDVSFHPQIVGTTWEGDWQMRTRAPIGTEQNPYDLSRVGGTGQRNTANCYVVNTSGHFKFPLFYGNAITNGSKYEPGYIFGGASKSPLQALRNFTDYKGNPISQPEIVGAHSAQLVWQDAYNLISNVKLTSDGYVSFDINKDNLQQGNAVLAVKDAAGAIIWSWHIWITEHWTEAGNLTLGLGDKNFDSYDNVGWGFTVAPYNLGWCDPKDVWYLKRTGKMTFTQSQSNQTATLDIEQREKKIEYWIGNNTYYQFGRKDPIVGFKNDQSVVKYNFGNLPYEIKSQPVSLADGIRNPNVLYVGAQESATNNDWNSAHYYNLWNNSTKYTIQTAAPGNESVDNYFYHSVKTVYDPSPAGYMVPPTGFFRIITNGKTDDASTTLDFNGSYEGMTGHSGYYTYKAYGKKGKTGDYISLTGTGHRWYGNNSTTQAGANFNPTIAYLWSSQVHFSTLYSAYGLALGPSADGSEYASNYRFIGRRAMARPVRPVRELSN